VREDTPSQFNFGNSMAIIKQNNIKKESGYPVLYLERCYYRVIVPDSDMAFILGTSRSGSSRYLSCPKPWVMPLPYG
jgi:hypothetical protein